MRQSHLIEAGGYVVHADVEWIYVGEKQKNPPRNTLRWRFFELGEVIKIHRNETYDFKRAQNPELEIEFPYHGNELPKKDEIITKIEEWLANNSLRNDALLSAILMFVYFLYSDKKSTSQFRYKVLEMPF